MRTTATTNRGSGSGYAIKPLPLERLPQVEMLRILSRRPAMNGLFDVDVTEARRLIGDEAARSGDRLSFTAFLTACLARAVDENRGVQAFRRGRRLIVFDEVDVATLVEVDAGGTRVPVFHVIRDAARRSVREIHRDIRRAQSTTTEVDRVRRRVRRMRWLPRPLRSLLWRALPRAPRTWKRYGGTVVLTSVGMFGTGSGWGLSTPGGYPLSLTVGGIGERPILVEGSLQVREHVSLTLSFNHEVLDGAPAARFAARLKELIEDPVSLLDGAAAHPDGR
jgi:pyruvate/2-oxoglutarate dehydrogenase complex dihydrolipoamide acyltransferase (E2) component